MKFLLDAHIPPRLVSRLRALGHDAIHVSTMPSGNATGDDEIIAFGDLEGRVVVTKDSDFRDARQATGRPARLVLVKTGNLSRDELIAIVLANLRAIEAFFADPNCGELRLTGLSEYS